MVGNMMALMLAAAAGVGGGVAGTQYEKKQFQSRLRTKFQNHILANQGISEQIRNRWQEAQAYSWNEFLYFIVGEIDAILAVATDEVVISMLVALRETLLPDPQPI